jgi:small redox-active disulfide protein 2
VNNKIPDTLIIRYLLISNIFKLYKMEIKILGPGCSKCKTLEKITREVVDEMGIAADIHKEEDIVKIMNYGIMLTPGLVINGKVVLSGRVPSAKEIKEILGNNQ